MAKEKFVAKTEASKNRAMATLKSKLGRRITSRLDGVKLDVKGKGWALIRPSGTELLIRLYVEGRNEKDLSDLVEEFKPLVAKAIR